jgi:hypothetical protein
MRDGEPGMSGPHAAGHIARSRVTIERAKVRIAASAALIQESQRRLLPMLCGGALAWDASEIDYARSRIRLFVHPHQTPTIYGGSTLEAGKNCDVCGQKLLVGAPEYELMFAASSLRLDRHCFAIWHSESAH